MEKPQPHDDGMQQLKLDALRIGEVQAGKVRQALMKAITPADFEKTTAELQRSVDRIFSEKLIQSGDTIDCKAGCSFCCYMKVDAHAWEIFRLVEYLRKKFSKEQLGVIHERAKANREKTKNLNADQRMALTLPCPLLQDGRCSCYDARPVMCRNHHSPRVSLCEAAFNHPGEEGMIGTVAEIKWTVAAVINLTAEAFAACGYDSTAYDLASALDEALSNPKCHKRWREGKRAFSKDVVAKEPEGDWV